MHARVPVRVGERRGLCVQQIKDKMMADRTVLEQIIRNERKQREDDEHEIRYRFLRLTGFSDRKGM